MKYGIRECCDVVMRAKGTQKIGKKTFYKDEPVCYFDTLKTSSLEGAATTVYAQGGRGNPRLMSWDGERTLTFTMEDALISPEGLAILAGAGLIEAASGAPLYQHVTEQVPCKVEDALELTEVPAVKDSENLIYVMRLDDDGNIDSEPIYAEVTTGKTIKVKTSTESTGYKALTPINQTTPSGTAYKFEVGKTYLVDYYVERINNFMQIEIEADKFGGSYYLEASTLWRDQNGVDHDAEFIIPNCRVQSNFTFTMAGSGDPSTFTFTIDAFPGYTRFDPTKKVLAAIQVNGNASGTEDDPFRKATHHDSTTA